MGVSCWVDESTWVLHLRWEGAITYEDVLAVQRERQEALQCDHQTLVDLTAVTEVVISSGQLESLARQVDKPARMAILAPTPSCFGIARRFEIISGLEHNGTKIGVFRTRSDAMAWLKGEGERHSVARV